MRLRLTISSILFGSLTTVAMLAQTPAFEVATLKISLPIQGDSFSINLGQVQNGKLTLGNASLSDCIKFAWGLVSDSQLAGPDWIKDKNVRFDITGQAPPGTTRSQAQIMLRTLLAERLKLAMHTEKKELAYLALVPAKNGPKMQPAKPDAPTTTGFQRAGNIAHNAMGLDLLVRLLSRFTGETVIDQTGLRDTWEVRLQWAPESKNPVPVPGGAVETPDGPSLYSAIQDQLGLRLLPRKGPVDVWVVDHADKIPADN